jgi:hypothetical protein
MTVARFAAGNYEPLKPTWDRYSTLPIRQFRLLHAKRPVRGRLQRP